MSAPSLISTGAAAHAQQSEVGGTSFLDLPLELREMVYDLCAPKKGMMCFQMPFQSKPVVEGINLLRCSKQIHAEISRRLYLWRSVFSLRFSSHSLPVDACLNVDCSLAMSAFHDFALAKIRTLGLNITLDPSTSATFDICGLQVLLKLTSLDHMIIHLRLESKPVDAVMNLSSDVAHLPLITGIIVRVLSHIPTRVRTVSWFVYYRDIPSESHKTLEKVVKQYKSVRGSAYTPQDDSDSS